VAEGIAGVRVALEESARVSGLRGAVPRARQQRLMHERTGVTVVEQRANTLRTLQYVRLRAEQFPLQPVVLPQVWPRFPSVISKLIGADMPRRCRGRTLTACATRGGMSR
jgi:hypothetical protein